MARELVVRLIGDDASLRRSFLGSSRAAGDFDKSLGRSARGAVAATLSFRGLGRALVFGSNAFLGGAGLAFAIKSTISAAEESQKVLAQTQNAVRAAGLSWATYGKQIRTAALAQSNLSGFDDERLLTTFSSLVRATGDVNKALQLNALAADVARGRNISLESSAQLVIKANAGMAGAVRRVLPFLDKNASATQLIAALQQKYAGAAATYGKTAAGAQDRFRVAVQNLQEAIGSGLLPEITKLLDPLSTWLNNSKNQERVQRDVEQVARELADGLKTLRDIVKGVDGVTGGFKHTLELMVGLKLALWSRNLVGDFRGVGKSAVVAEGQVATLKGSLGTLAGITVAPIVIPIEMQFGKKERDFLTKHAGLLGNAGKALLDIATGGGAITGGNLVQDLGGGIVNSLKFSNPTPRATDATGTNPAAEAAAKAAAGRARAVAQKVIDATAKAINDVQKKSSLTAGQKNTFFDNAIARILLRGGLGNIQQQIAALQKADSLIAARLKVTKDVTRRLNLEDELLQNAAQITSLQGQAAADALQAQQDALQKRRDAFDQFIAGLQLNVTKAQATGSFRKDIAALKALQNGIKAEIKEFGATSDLQGQLFDVQQQIAQARKDQAAKGLADLTAKQFRQLGLTATGDERTPGVAALKRRLGQLSANVAASSLNTPKLQSELARFRKVLGEGLVPKDVRSKIKEMLDGINEQLAGHTRNLTRFSHVNSDALLKGLGLDADTTRILRQRIAQVGAGGTVPGVRSPAFALAGGAAATQTTIVQIDGREVGRAVTRHNAKEPVRQPSRRG